MYRPGSKAYTRGKPCRPGSRRRNLWSSLSIDMTETSADVEENILCKWHARTVQRLIPQVCIYQVCAAVLRYVKRSHNAIRHMIPTDYSKGITHDWVYKQHTSRAIAIMACCTQQDPLHMLNYVTIDYRGPCRDEGRYVPTARGIDQRCTYHAVKSSLSGV